MIPLRYTAIISQLDNLSYSLGKNRYQDPWSIIISKVSKLFSYVDSFEQSCRSDIGSSFSFIDPTSKLSKSIAHILNLWQTKIRSKIKSHKRYKIMSLGRLSRWIFPKPPKLQETTHSWSNDLHNQ